MRPCQTNCWQTSSCPPSLQIHWRSWSPCPFVPRILAALSAEFSDPYCRSDWEPPEPGQLVLELLVVPREGLEPRFEPQVAVGVELAAQERCSGPERCSVPERYFALERCSGPEHCFELDLFCKISRQTYKKHHVLNKRLF